MGFREDPSLPTWRRLALGAWGSPRDPTAYGMLDLDVEPALAYIGALRAASGEKITLTHLVGKAIADAIAEHPEVNGFASRGRLMLRDTVDVFFQVAFFDESPAPPTKGGKKGANLAGAKVRAADTKSAVEIARELRERAERIRAKADAETARGAATLSKLPNALVGLAARAGAMLSYDLGLDLSRFGIPYDAFGSCMVTNVGVFGIPVAWAPLFSLSRVPIVLTLGAVREVVRAHQGAAAVRRSATIGVAFDHRVLDGYHAGKMAARFLEVLADPGAYLGPPRRPPAQPDASADP
jgi:pyruvate dehydrogenase E2 component (dihydrolipoamide acetyltransferase)